MAYVHTKFNQIFGYFANKNNNLIKFSPLMHDFIGNLILLNLNSKGDKYVP